MNTNVQYSSPAGPGLEPYGTTAFQDTKHLNFVVGYNSRGDKATIGNILANLRAGRFKANSEYYGLLDITRAAGYSDSAALELAEEAMYVSSQNPDVFPTWWDAIYGLPQIASKTGAGGPTSSTVRSVNISSLSEAYAVGEAAWVENLGRNMNKKEAKAFQAALNKMQEQNPTVTQTTSTGGANNFSSQRTSGGFDSAQWAQDYARSQEGYSERLVATKMMDAMDAFISGGLRPGMPELRGDS